MRTIDPANPYPLFRQIETSLRDAIASGEFAPGDRIPSLAALAAHFDTSVATVQRALLALHDDGLLTSRARLGSFVATPGAADHATDQLLARAVDACSPGDRHLLIDRMARALADSAPTLSSCGHCACGHQMRQGTAYSLDYSVGWQEICHEDGDWHGVTETNDQDTVASLMCPACHRLYQLPAGTPIHWN